MNNMTDAEIIKALECRASKEDVLCTGCPYEKYYLLDCQRQSAQDALDLINHQKAEIERLNKEISISQHLLSDAWRNIEIQDKFYKTARAEAIKEFAERLKEDYRPKEPPNHYIVIGKYEIDNLVKEMVGEDK